MICPICFNQTAPGSILCAFHEKGFQFYLKYEYRGSDRPADVRDDWIEDRIEVLLG